MVVKRGCFEDGVEAAALVLLDTVKNYTGRVTRRSRT